MRISVLAATAAFLLPALAGADSFAPVPKLGGKADRDLQIRFVRYDGSTNGEMVVDVRNTGKRSRVFTAEGIYFIPDGDPEKAPQRLGAAGPFELVKGKARKEARKLTVAPGATERLHLAVFCIDSHRSSPSSEDTFKIARKRMPRQLRDKIKASTRKAIRRHGGAKRAKSAIQSGVWKERDEAWIQLEGERAHEKTPRSKRPIRRHYRQRQQ
jgi:hypothetical protein